MGRLAPEKNLGLLLRAVAASGIAGVRVVLAGGGTCRAEWEALAADLGLGSRVIFPGFLADPASCYGAFDLFAMSSDTEQMPLALLEAMAAGLPAICTDVGDSAEILGSRDGRRCRAGRPRRLHARARPCMAIRSCAAFGRAIARGAGRLIRSSAWWDGSNYT